MPHTIAALIPQLAATRCALVEGTQTLRTHSKRRVCCSNGAGLTTAIGIAFGFNPYPYRKTAVARHICLRLHTPPVRLLQTGCHGKTPCSAICANDFSSTCNDVIVCFFCREHRTHARTTTLPPGMARYRHASCPHYSYHSRITLGGIFGRWVCHWSHGSCYVG